MADERTKALSQLRGTEAAKAKVKDEVKSRLQTIANAVGNEEIAKRIESGNATRDQMLAFITERLALSREMQLRELALTNRNAHFEWWAIAADRMKPDRQEPAPTRWNAVARAYEAAVLALCSGNLTRGQALLEEAHALEKKTADETTELADTNDIEDAASLDPNAFAALVAQTPSSGACAEPTDIRRLIDAIVNVEQTVPDMPNRRRRRDPWWTLEEDEEEEDKPNGEGG